MQGALTERSAQIIGASRGMGAAGGQRLNAPIDIDRVSRPSGAERSGAALHLGISGQGAQRKRRSDRGRHPASDDHFGVGDAVPSLESIIEIFACTAHTAIAVHCPTCPRMSDSEHSMLRAIAAAQKERDDIAREQFECWLPPVGADWALAPVRGLATIFRMAGLILPDRHVPSLDHDQTMAMKSWLVGSPTLH
ncbi:hypothetical protein ABIB75_005972 [Bradyrhizobium sp. GM2.2]